MARLRNLSIALVWVVMLMACRQTDMGSPTPVAFANPPTPIITHPTPTLAPSPTPADQPAPSPAVATAQSPAADPPLADSPALIAPPTPFITPLIEPSPTATSCAEPGRMEHASLDSAVAGEPMRYRVYLPPCYGREGDLYPTLYMFGGNVHDDGIWDALGLDETAEEAIARGDIPPLLIVMPDNGWLANTTTSGPDSYEGFVLNELIPHIEAAYHAQPDADGRAAGGLSRGGYWSLMMAFRRSDLFRSVGAHSPALIDSHAGPAEDPEITGVTNDLGGLRVWIDIGERDPYLIEARPLHEALAAAGVPHEWRVNEGTHDEAYWQAHLMEYLIWYSQGWSQSH